MSKTGQIWNFKLSLGFYQDITMPAGAQVLDIQKKDDIFQLWAAVDPSRGLETKRIVVIGTGQTYDVENMKYIKTIQDGEYVWHIFEVIFK